MLRLCFAARRRVLSAKQPFFHGTALPSSPQRRRGASRTLGRFSFAFHSFPPLARQRVVRPLFFCPNALPGAATATRFRENAFQSDRARLRLREHRTRALRAAHILAYASRALCAILSFVTSSSSTRNPSALGGASSTILTASATDRQPGVGRHEKQRNACSQYQRTTTCMTRALRVRSALKAEQCVRLDTCPLASSSRLTNTGAPNSFVSCSLLTVQLMSSSS